MHMLIVVFLLFVSVNIHADTQTYEVDRHHSNVGFKVRHFGIADVVGEFSEFSGTIEFDEDDLKNSSVSATVNTASVKTGFEKRDLHVRDDDFLSSEQYPTMKLESTRVIDHGDKVVMIANLTIRDQTHPVKFDGKYHGKFTSSQGNSYIGFSAEGHIDRHKFGLKFNRLDNGVVVVGDHVTIMLDIQAKKTGS